MTRVGMAALAAAVAMLAGCAGGQSGSPGGQSGSPGGQAGAGLAERYRLYTHCGIREANIGGRWYLADPPQDDGNGNPPAGWGNPYQDGFITPMSATETLFTDRAGHRVRFVLRAGATAPEQICS